LSWDTQAPSLRRLNMSPLKKFAQEKLLPSSVLRQVLLSERDNLSFAEFVARIEIWLRLMRWEERR